MDLSGLLHENRIGWALAVVSCLVTTSLTGCGSVAESGITNSERTSLHLDEELPSPSSTAPSGTNVEVLTAVKIRAGADTANSQDLATGAPQDVPLENQTTSRNPDVQNVSTTSGSAEQVKFLGEWTDHFHGRRVMKFAADGTGMMILELDTVGALLYGSKLEFDFQWTLAGNVLEMKMMSGRPKATTESLSKSWGAEHKYEILEISPEVFSIRNFKGQTVCHLKPCGTVAQAVRP